MVKLSNLIFMVIYLETLNETVKSGFVVTIHVFIDYLNVFCAISSGKYFMDDDAYLV